MKKISALLLLVLGTTVLNAQNENSNEEETPVVIRCGATIDDKALLYIIDGVPLTSKELLKEVSPSDILSIQVLKNPPEIMCYGTAGKNGVVIIKTKKFADNQVVSKELPFRVHCISNTDWSLHQDMYNALVAKVPSLTIKNNTTLSGTPRMHLRGEEITEVIVDGIRYDTSILNTLNPNDIKHIRVAPSVAATNYFRNASPTN